MLFSLIFLASVSAVTLTRRGGIHPLGKTCGGVVGYSCEQGLRCHWPNPVRLASPGYCVYTTAKEGEDCSGEVGTPAHRRCGEGLVCDKVCVKERNNGPFAKFGEACGALPCVPNGECVQGVCVETFRGLGELCEGSRPYIFQCQLPLQCIKTWRKPLEVGVCLDPQDIVLP
jgi:hypothetical protein